MSDERVLCTECRYADFSGRGDEGRCRKNPPTAAIVVVPLATGVKLLTVWPVVQYYDWCGEGTRP